MTATQLLSAYPHIPYAIAWVELMLCPSTLDDQDGFGMMIRSGLDPSQVVEMVKTTVRDAIAEEEIGKEREALAQMDHPEFMRFICGKMGAM